MRKPLLAFLMATIAISLLVGSAQANTFGYTSVGATELSIQHCMRGSKYYLDERALAYSVAVNLRSASSLDCNLRVGIFDENYTLMASTQYINKTYTNTATWYTYNLDKNVTLEIGYYWILAWGNSSAGEPTVRYNAGGASEGTYESINFVQNGIPYVVIPDVMSDRWYSMYVNYELIGDEQEMVNAQMISSDWLTFSALMALSFVCLLLAWKSNVPIINFVFGIVTLGTAAYYLGSSIVFAGWINILAILMATLSMLSGVMRLRGA